MFVRHQVGRVKPVFRFGVLSGGQGGPQIDPARHVGFEGDMLDPAAQIASPARVKGQVHHRQDRGRGPEGILQRQVSQMGFDLGQPRSELQLHGIEGFKIGTLERIDRLLLVADDKDRARCVARAPACGEFLRQKLDHAPLFRTGVLCLVDKDVVNAAVQPEQHPLRHRRIGQQSARLADQIVKIKPAAHRLSLVVLGQEQRGKAVQGQRPLCGHQGQPSGPGRLDPQDERLKRGKKGTQRVAQVFCGEGVDLCGKRGLRLFTEKKQILQNPKPGKTGFDQA